MSNFSFDKREQERLRAAVQAGQEAVCPRCERKLDSRRVEPRRDVSYVRDRVWLTCGHCDISLMIDVKTTR